MEQYYAFLMVYSKKKNLIIEKIIEIQTAGILQQG